MIDFAPDAVRHLLQQLPSHQSPQRLYDLWRSLVESQTRAKRIAEAKRANARENLTDASAAATSGGGGGGGGGAEAAGRDGSGGSRDALDILMEGAEEARQLAALEASVSRGVKQKGRGASDDTSDVLTMLAATGKASADGANGGDDGREGAGVGVGVGVGVGAGVGGEEEVEAHLKKLAALLLLEECQQVSHAHLRKTRAYLVHSRRTALSLSHGFPHFRRLPLLPSSSSIHRPQRPHHALLPSPPLTRLQYHDMKSYDLFTQSLWVKKDARSGLSSATIRSISLQD